MRKVKRIDLASADTPELLCDEVNNYLSVPETVLHGHAFKAKDVNGNVVWCQYIILNVTLGQWEHMPISDFTKDRHMPEYYEELGDLQAEHSRREDIWLYGRKQNKDLVEMEFADNDSVYHVQFGKYDQLRPEYENAYDR
jgi:hypothetical protein